MQLYQRVKRIANELSGSETKLAKAIGVQQKKLNTYIRLQKDDNLLPLLFAILEEYPQISRDWLFFGEGEMLKGPRQMSAMEIAGAVPTPDIDKEILRSVVRVLEEMLETAKKNLPPDAKAEVICQLYQLLANMEEDQMSKPAHMFSIIHEAIAKAS